MIYNSAIEKNNVLKNVKKEYFGKDELNKRYLHTLGVVEKALEINEMYHFHIKKQTIIEAAGYHDIAKLLPKEVMLEMINKEYPNLADELVKYPSIWHSFVGKVYAREKYHVKDDEVLNAICYHTTGRLNMSILEKIIFISDFIEERTRNGEYLESVRKMLKKDFEQTIFEILRLKMEYVNQKNDKVYDLTNETYQYYLSEAKKVYKKVVKILNKAVVKDIRVYDMKNITPFYDYTLICSVNSARQGDAAINYLRDASEELGLRVRSFSSSTETTWFLIDLDDIVVHLFVGDERRRYNLDEMYGNNPILIVE